LWNILERGGFDWRRRGDEAEGMMNAKAPRTARRERQGVIGFACAYGASYRSSGGALRGPFLRIKCCEDGVFSGLLG
jgi:hypothetical protein